MSNFKLCITGGSGFIGTSAMSWSLSNYKSINFDIKSPQIFEHQKYWRYIDIRDAVSFTEALIEFQPTHILHLAAKTGMDITDMTFFEANTSGVANLIKASKDVPSLKRILFTSSLLVCQNGHVPLSDTEYDPPNLYGESKVIGERLVRTSSMNCSWVIVRPTSIWGPWFEHSYRTFFKLIDSGVYIQPGNKKIYKPQSFVDNTVYMMQKLLFIDDKTVDGRTFYLGDYPETSIQEWADKIKIISGHKGKNIVSPIYVLWILAFLGDMLKKIGWKDPPLTSFRLKNILTGAHYPIENTKKFVGELPFSLEEGILQTLEWMRKEKIIKSKNYGY